ncbi:substrate-binding periplasmic protein [Vibrio atypicus]|uniref:substrate-binding periplasmic protein n=1 Tax=Vibrio atypicus TaxID=558271 RepID=UPI001358E9F7|nr:transporter substrate-binding domain-containing protein [Vibrio atypicus]
MRFLILSLVFAANLSFADTFVAHCRDRAPDLIPTADGGCDGPVAEMIEKAMTQIGHDVDWKVVPWARTINVAETGGVDIIPRHSMNSEREAFLNPILYGYQTRDVYFVISPKSNIQIASADDLLQHRIGALRGSYYSKTFNDNDKIKKKLYNHTDQIIQALEMGRIEVAIASSAHGIDELMAINGTKKAQFVDTFYNGRFISVPKRSPMHRHAEALNKTIQEMRSKGEIDAIYKKYNLTPIIQKAE